MLSKQGFNAHMQRILELHEQRNKHLIPAKYREADYLLMDAIEDLWLAMNESGCDD